MKKNFIWAFLCLLIPYCSYSATWYVKPGGSCSNSGLSWGLAFNDLQCAINAASNGDNIYIAAGTYLPTETANGASSPATDLTFHANKTLNIYGGFTTNDATPNDRTYPYTTNETILSGNNTSYHVLYRYGQNGGSLYLDGVTIANGNANGTTVLHQKRGSGLYSTTPNPNTDVVSIKDCVFKNNQVLQFGSIYLGYNTTLNITKSEFDGNYSDDRAGVIYSVPSSTLNISDSEFKNNTAEYGGALSVSGDVTITGSNFNNNSATVKGGAIATMESFNSFEVYSSDFKNNTSWGATVSRGGAISISTYDGTLIPIIEDCTFELNEANEGGAIHQAQSTVDNEKVIYNRCVFFNNKALNYPSYYGSLGGAICNPAGEIINTVFHANSAGKNGGAIITNNEDIEFTNCTFTKNTCGNQGGAIWEKNNANNSYAYNCIFWMNSATDGNDIYDLYNEFIIDHCFTQEHGMNNSFGNKVASQYAYTIQFSNINLPAGSDGIWRNGDDGLILQVGSDPIDAGDNNHVTSILVDIKQDPRIETTTNIVEMGAYEGSVAAIPNCNINGKIHVDLNATGANTGECWLNAYTSLQTALANATSGDEIWIASGTYKPTHDLSGSIASTSDETVFNISITDLKIYGGFAAWETVLSQRVLNPSAPTVLSGNTGSISSENSWHVLYRKNVNGNLTLNGLTIQDGYADGNSSPNGDDHGGGLYTTTTNSSSKDNINLEDIIFYNNFSTQGAGAYFPGYSVNANISRTTFRENRTSKNGAGIMIPTDQTDVTISNGSLFESNVSVQSGGALAINGKVNISNTQFSNNIADLSGGAIDEQGLLDELTIDRCSFLNNQSVNFGGAIRLASNTYVSTPEIINSVFENNSSGTGGAIFQGSLASGDIVISHCFFYKNKANDNNGGGIYGIRGYIDNSVFYENYATLRGGAIHTANSDALTITNSTFVQNEAYVHGGAIFKDINTYPLYLYNSITWNNRLDPNGGGSGRDVYDQNSTCIMHYSLSETFGTHGFNNNIVGSIYNPGFVSQSNPKGSDGEWGTPGDGLTPTNYVINNGLNSYATNRNITEDSKYTNRFFNSTVDRGAYEYCYGCSSKTDHSTSINEINVSKGVIVYPNPADNYVTIKVNDNSGVVSLEVYNLIGKRVLSETTTNNAKVDLSNLSNGVYLIKIKTETESYTKQLIIQ